VNSYPNDFKNRIIQEALQEGNERIFSQKGVQVDLLKNCAQTIPTFNNYANPFIE
jgi:transposase-like protein